MKMITSVTTGVVNFADRVCAVAGALLFSQFPAFYQQYIQRLGGHLEELNRYLHQLERLAQHSSKTLPEYIHKFLTSSDADFSAQGVLMQSLVQRQLELSDYYQQLRISPALFRPWALLTHFESESARGALADFEFGLVLSLEGLAYAVLGIVFGYFCFSCFKRLCWGIGKLPSLMKRAVSGTN